MIEVRRYGGKWPPDTILLGTCMGILVVAAFFSDAIRITLVVVLPIYLTGFYRDSLSIKMDRSGCEMKSLLSKRLLQWSDFQTIRIQDFSGSNDSRDPYLYSDQGIIFSTHRIKKHSWVWIDLPTYLWFTDSFCRSRFYIQFDPTEKCKWKEKIRNKNPILYHVDREEFMARAAEWGLKIEGLNAPMPPELTKTKQ